VASPTIERLTVTDAPEAWAAAGFAVKGGLCEIGSVRLELAGPGRGRGIVAWALRDVGPGDLDGVPTAASEAPLVRGGPHPNGATGVDHVVAMTPDLDRSMAAFEAGGLDLRRVREEPTPGGAPRQAFFRMGEVILEVVQAPEGTRIASDPAGPARLWGLALRVEDLERTARQLGELLGTPRPAVQAGRSIATLNKEAGLGPAVAFMTPPG